MNYPYTIKFTDRDEFNRVHDALRIPEKAKCSTWRQPPKEYKSSPYRVWFDYYDYISPHGTQSRAYNLKVMIFRDEEDYLMALLLV